MSRPPRTAVSAWLLLLLLSLPLRALDPSVSRIDIRDTSGGEWVIDLDPDNDNSLGQATFWNRPDASGKQVGQLDTPASEFALQAGDAPVYLKITPSKAAAGASSINLILNFTHRKPGEKSLPRPAAHATFSNPMGSNKVEVNVKANPPYAGLKAAGLDAQAAGFDAYAGRKTTNPQPFLVLGQPR